MGLFNRDKDKKASNAVQVNNVNESPLLVCGWDGLWTPHKKGFKPFGKLYLQTALNWIFNGVSNISFETVGGVSNYTANGICSFLDNNASLLVSQWLGMGFLAVFYDRDHNYKIANSNDLRFDQFGRVINRNTVVVYSPIYQTEKKGYMMLAKPAIQLLDTLANTLSESAGTMGVLPILSGNSIPANPQFKEQLSEAMTKTYGWGADQLKYFLSQQELKVDKIDLQIKDLELRDNLLATFTALLNYFEIPVDLVIGNSTYDNVREAKVFFYENTIKKYAENFLKLGRNLLTASNEFIPQNTITYRLTNVSGLENTLKERCEQTNAYIDTLLKLKEAGVDIGNDLSRVYSDIRKDYLEV